MPPTLYLSDGHALAYRTYFALTGAGGGSRWITSAGEPTAGIFGFTSVLLRILEQEQPDHLAVAFDTGKTFRDEMFPEYKATREKMPDDLRTQIERIRQLVDTFNIPRLEMEGYEADDVLGSVSRRVAGQGLGVKIITGDQDLLQLVTDRIIVSLPGRKLSESQDYLPDDVIDKLGVRPDQVVDYKAMVGDKSDNIPGVVGVGKKTAEKLLSTYDTLDGVYDHLDDLAAGIRKKLETDRQNAFLSRDLAAIITDLEIDLDLDQARSDRFDPKAVQSLFRELEFRALMPRLNAVMSILGIADSAGGEQMQMFAAPSGSVPTPVDLGIETVIVDTPAALQALKKTLSTADVIAFDTETTSTDQMEAELVGISLAVDSNRGYYIPVGHAPSLGSQLPLDEVLDALRPTLTSPDIPKAGHNLKYDYVILSRLGLSASPLAFDSMLAEWICNPASRNLGLKNLAWIRLDLQMTEISTLIGSGRNQITMDQVPIEQAAPYAAADAAIVLRLMPNLQKEMKEKDVDGLFRDLEMPLVSVLAHMEMDGISLDTDFLEKMSTELVERMAAIKEKVFQATGEPFNLNSTQQLSKALFERLKLTPPDGAKRTASGHYSTAAGVLESIRDQHPAIEWILENRELAKLQSTYIEALPSQINPSTGRVHTSFNQAGTVTGRIASSNPNLQNIPIRTDIGRKVRHAFVAPPGRLLLAVDYSQIELRIVAHMAEDDAMIAAFKAGQDIHAATASAIYEVPLQDVTAQQRRHAKAINFGLIYGMSPFGLTRTTDLTLAEAENFVSSYFQQFPGVKQFLDDLRKTAAKQGYVETLLGRRRYFHGLTNPSNQIVRRREEREAINSPIQGTAADIMKLAMLAVHRMLSDSRSPVKMLLQVHDELMLECPRDQIREIADMVKREMTNAYQLKVPLVADAKAGENWGKMAALEN